VVGGDVTRLAVVMTATTLLLFAANTAIIGGYHVFLALAQQGFLPRPILARNRAFGTPHFAIAITTIVPIASSSSRKPAWSSSATCTHSGCSARSCCRRSASTSSAGGSTAADRSFYLGLLTSAMVIVAWSVNLFAKPLATVFGGGVTLVGMAIALGMREGWLTEAIYRIGFVGRLATRAMEEAERKAEEGAVEIVSLAQASELRPLFPSHTWLRSAARRRRSSAKPAAG